MQRHHHSGESMPGMAGLHLTDLEKVRLLGQQLNCIMRQGQPAFAGQRERHASIMGVSGGRPAALAMAGASSQYHSAFEGLFSGTKVLGFSLSLMTPSTCTCM